MQLKGYKINEQGFYMEDYIYEEGKELESNVITMEMSEGFYKPKWDGGKWVEGATEDYINSLKSILPQPTPEDLLRAKILKDNANFQLQLAQQQQINANLLSQIAKLSGGAQNGQ